MGGLTDATNVIKNTIVAGLASISMDHIGVLGNTLGEIAVQKAGIIKPGCTGGERCSTAGGKAGDS